MMFTLMGTLAQNEVESISKNVKMGIKMKMKSGELMGFNGCLGYDYHPEDVIVFGDGANDETMFCKFHHSRAMQNAVPVIREIAEKVIDSNRNNGVAKEINQILGVCL